ncbi:MAG TPA: exodeoxyribonuclease III, partial [Chloroflexota bacterium]|nr:exodeoxyribonuclease III [Chloroflexota bacterium]
MPFARFFTCHAIHFSTDYPPPATKQLPAYSARSVYNPHMVTLYSWNVNGIRAAQNKGFLNWLHQTQPDILWLQETKAHPDQLDNALRQPDGYHTYWAWAEKKGYSGVALYSKMEPRHVQIGLGIPDFDREGRTIVAEYDHFVFIGAYFPNGGRDHGRVPFKMQYKADFLAYCNKLRAQGKAVVFCGDVNTSHKEIDLARPKQNRKTT